MRCNPRSLVPRLRIQHLPLVVRTLCLFHFACVVSSGLLVAADDSWSIERLNSDKEHWGNKLETPLKIEGRVSAVSKHQFRFVHCDLTFHVTEDQSRTIGNVRNVEVTGRMKKDKETGKLLFAVDRVKTLPSDVEQYEIKESKQKSTNAADWYDLARWAESRGRFYADMELTSKARRSWIKGIQYDRQALPDGDADARFLLAKKVDELELDKRLSAELFHEGARLNWQQAIDSAKQRDEFAKWMKANYPDCTTPLEKWPADLEKRYAAQPLETFHGADDANRAVLQRLFFLHVEQTRILSLAKEDGSNASAIADAIADRIPERNDLIENYRETAFQWRLKSIASASRQEAVRLAEELKARQDPEHARDLLRGWIRSREQRLRSDGPLGLMQLAEDTLQLIHDEPAAVQLLAEAHQLDPSFTDPGERLKQLGYRLHQNRWTKDDASDTPAATGKAPSQLAVGMTSEDVLSLLGSPNSKSRIITKLGIQEVWSFGRRGTPRLLIHVQSTSGNATPRVTRFLTEN